MLSANVGKKSRNLYSASVGSLCFQFIVKVVEQVVLRLKLFTADCYWLQKLSESAENSVYIVSCMFPSFDLLT